MVNYQELANRIIAKITGSDASNPIKNTLIANLIRQEVEGVNNTTTVNTDAVIVEDPALEEHYRNLPAFTQSVVVGDIAWQEFVG